MRVRRTWFSLIVAVASTAIASLVVTIATALPDALAHGGAYQPPTDPIGPTAPPPPGGGPTTGGGIPGGPTTGGGGPPTPPAGDVPGGPTTGGPTLGGGDLGGPTTGGPGKGGAPLGSGPTPGGSGGGWGPYTPGGTLPPRRSTPQGPDSDHWTRWWFANRANLLDLDTHLSSNGASTPGGAPATEAMWRGEAQRVLTLALADADEDVSSGAAVALGKAADSGDAPVLTALLADRKRQQPVRESAALALGLIQMTSHPASAAATRALEDVISRDSEPERLRAMAAWALGMRRDPAAVPFLLDLVTAKSPSPDVPSAATSALGLSGCDAVKESLLEWLDGTVGRRRHETMRRVHACHALAHLGDRSVVPALREALRDDDEDVRRAAALALGALAQKDDDDTALLLVRALDRDKDRGVRNIAALSLGRIAPTQAEKALRYAYAKGDGLSQPFAALGLGLLARSTGDASLTFELRNDLKDRANADLRGAIAIALGLARDAAAAKTLRAIVADRGDPELRAHACLALGMIRDVASADSLRLVVADTRDPVLQRECAMALGLLGDAKSVGVLTHLVEDGSSLYVQGAAAMALGRIGGAEASTTLGRLLGDAGRPGLARGFAAVGLGYALDNSGGRSLARVGAHLDWYVPTTSVLEILTIL
ncbi:MAG: HEAT repeat domain-containing protein [Planctomycetes bacterium]|nr:HEAT repeat domain-containing protein [Planctomycetota bacterium]